MAELIPIKVECHAGYKADEYPICFYLDDERFVIQEIKDRWYQGDRDPACPVSDYFKVATAGGRSFIIKHELGNDKWFLCR
jgi:hypothetical protein